MTVSFLAHERRIMIRILAFIAIFGLPMIAMSAQVSGTVPQKSPEEVVRDFWKVETDGGRLSLEGWYKATEFFVRSNVPAPNRIIHIIGSNHTDNFEETARTENWAEVSLTTNELGQLDSTMRFTRSAQRGPHGELLLRGPLLTFHLVLTSKHWELNQDGARGKELTGSPQWLIDCPENASWITVDTAIRYVTETRTKTTDPSIKKNADETLTKLTKLH